MILKTGERREDLLAYLKRLDDAVSMDSVIQSGEKVSLTLWKKGPGITWALDRKMPDSPAYQQGIRYESLKRALDGLYEEVKATLSDVVYVLSYKGADPERDYRGNLVTRWHKILPGAPAGEGFEEVPLSLTDADAKAMTATGAAFAIERNGEVVYYPLSSISLPSVGRLLDSEGLFKDGYVSFGGAIFLAERLLAREKFSFLARGKKGAVRPLLSMVGGRYMYVPQAEFYNAVFNKAARLGTYKVSKWSVSDDLTKVEMRLLQEERDYKVIVTTSDLASASMTFITAVKVGPAMAYLDKFGYRHTLSFNMDRDVSEAMDRISDVVQKMNDTFSIFEKLDVIVTRDMLEARFEHILGTKRLSSLTFKEGRMKAMTALLMVVRTIEGQHYVLPVKQAEQLCFAYAELVNDLIKNKVDDQPAEEEGGVSA